MDVGLVCDQCSAYNALDAARCARCWTPLAFDDVAFDGKTSMGPGPSKIPGELSSPHAAVEPVAGDNPCPVCGAAVIQGHRFCGECGARMPSATSATRPPPEPRSTSARPGMRSTSYFAAIQAARAKLTVIRGDGLDGVSFNLAGEEHHAGRVGCPLLFPDDPFLSPVHCNFLYRGRQLVVRDEGSVNGVYVRIQGARGVRPGATVLIGEQVLELSLGHSQRPGLDEATADGTYFFASPPRAGLVRIVQRLRGGDTALAFCAAAEAATVGREGNDLDFPDDPFISGRHASIGWDGRQIVVTDLGSKNGTFLRVDGEQVLEHGDYVFMGQQLLRVEIV